MLPESRAFERPRRSKIHSLLLHKAIGFSQHFLEQGLDFGQTSSFSPLFPVKSSHICRIDFSSSVKSSLVILIVQWEISGHVTMVDQILHYDQVIDAIVHQLQSVDVGENGAILILVDLESQPHFVELVDAVVVERADVFGCRF